MKTLTLAAIRCSLMFTAVAALFVQSAQAYTVTLQQMGANVVAHGNGAINLTGLTFSQGPLGISAQINAPFASIITGSGGDINSFTGVTTGPTSFGIGNGGFNLTNGSGNQVGINGSGQFVVLPVGYVSNDPLSSSATWDNATFASLGVTPGTYEWTWGTGLPNQNFTLIVGGTGVPDTGSTVSLLGCALLGLAALRRRLSC